MYPVSDKYPLFMSTPLETGYSDHVLCIVQLAIDWNNITSVLLSLLQLFVFQRYTNSAID